MPVSCASAVFLIQKMDCPTEERLIRGRLEGMPGVESLSFNLIQRELTVAHRLPSVAPLVAALMALDMEPAVKADSLSRTGTGDAPSVRSTGDYSIPRRKWVLLAVAGDRGRQR